MDYKTFLDTTVLQEKKPVTYRYLARSLNIHVNIAKQALYHYTTVEPKVIAIYCLTGILPDSTFAIQLVPQTDFEETKKSFSQVTGVHVYSVLPYQPKDLSVLVTANKDMVTLSLEDRVKNGLIHNKSITAFKTQALKEMSTIKSPTTVTTTKAATNPPATIKSPSSASISKKTPTTSTTLKPSSTKRKGTLSFDKATPAKKQAVEKPKEVSPSMLSKSRKVKAIQESDDDDVDEESEDEEALDARLARSATIQVNDIFSDDDDEEMQSVEKGKEQGDDKKVAIVSENTKHDENDDELCKAAPLTLAPTQMDEDAPSHEATTPGKVRRKVQKKKTYRNERGFLVTEDVWEWEEVDAEHVPSAPLPVKKDTPSPKQSISAGKKASGEQKSLLSFWGKK